MPLTIGEKIKIILKRKSMTMSELADILEVSRQNLSNKISRNNFTEKDAKEIANALGYDYKSIFISREDGTEI